MLMLIGKKNYLVEGIAMTFLETIKNGEVSVFDANGIRIKLDTEDLIGMEIKEVQ